MSLDLKLKLGGDFPVQSAYMQCRERWALIMGPRGSSKTFSTAQRILIQMTEQAPNDRGTRPTRGMVARYSYNELMNTTVKDFLDVFRDLGDFKQSGTPTWHSKPGLYLSDGSLLDADVVFQSTGVDDVESAIKGHQLTYAWFNEGSGQPKIALDTADAGLGRYPSPVSGGVPCTWRGGMLDTNAFDESHWLWPLFTSPPPGWAAFRQPGALIDSGQVDGLGRKRWRYNPAAECYMPEPEKFYTAIASGKDDEWIKVLLANEFGFHVEGQPVHPEYIDSQHCSAVDLAPDPQYPILLGIDFGRTPAAAFVQHLEAVDQWIGFDEMCTDNMSASLFAPQLRRYLDRRYPGFQVMAYGDPAGDRAGQTIETTPIQILRAAGIPIQPAPSNVPALRRAALANPLTRIAWASKRPAFVLSPRCKMIRKGLMGGYCYRKLRLTGSEERYGEEPDKNQYSHPVEALEYALLGGGEGRAALRPPRSSGPVQEMADSEWSAWR